LHGSMPSASSPSGSLPEVRFSRVLVSLCVGSLIRLRAVKVFDEADLPTPNPAEGRLVSTSSPQVLAGMIWTLKLC
jgi:hypothetical protein